MSKLWVTLFCAAGVAAFVYSKMSRRIGYGNTKNIVTLVGVSFVLSALVLYSILAVVL